MLVTVFEMRVAGVWYGAWRLGQSAGGTGQSAWGIGQSVRSSLLQVLGGPKDGLETVWDADLLVDIEEMGSHRMMADEKLGGYFSVLGP